MNNLKKRIKNTKKKIKKIKIYNKILQKKIHKFKRNFYKLKNKIWKNKKIFNKNFLIILFQNKFKNQIKLKIFNIKFNKIKSLKTTINKFK